MSDTDAEKLAVLRQRSDDHQEQIRAFGPLVSQFAVLDERVAGVQAGLNKVREHVERVEDDCEKQTTWTLKEFADRDERDRQRAEKARKDKIALYIALVGLLLTFGGLIVAVVQLLGQS